MAIHHLIGRSVDFVTTVASNSDDDNVDQVSPFAVIVFALTCLAFGFLIFCFSYTYGHVIPTLCMIESPETNTYVPVSNISASADEPPAYTEDNEDGTPKPADDADEALLVRSKPITSSLRATAQHLHARAGRGSRLRGLPLFILWGFCRNVIVSILSAFSRRSIVVAVSAVIAEILLAHVHMTWIHVVISEPSTKRWYNRIPRPMFQTWKKIAPATAVWAITTHIVYILPAAVMGLGHAGSWSDPDYQPGKKELYSTMGQTFGAMILLVSLFVLLEVPAMVMLVRVAASMLPEEDETIVPFDRTYGGKVTPAIVGGDGKIDMVEAWRSFPWASRKRLLILCAKAVGLLMLVWTLFSVTVVLEAQLLFGTEAFGQMMKGLSGGRR